MYWHKDRYTDKNPEKDIMDIPSQTVVDEGAKTIQRERTILPTDGVLKTR